VQLKKKYFLFHICEVVKYLTLDLSESADISHPVSYCDFFITLLAECRSKNYSNNHFEIFAVINFCVGILINRDFKRSVEVVRLAEAILGTISELSESYCDAVVCTEHISTPESFARNKYVSQLKGTLLFMTNQCVWAFVDSFVNSINPSKIGFIFMGIISASGQKGYELTRSILPHLKKRISALKVQSLSSFSTGMTFYYFLTTLKQDEWCSTTSESKSSAEAKSTTDATTVEESLESIIIKMMKKAPEGSSQFTSWIFFALSYKSVIGTYQRIFISVSVAFNTYFSLFSKSSH